MLSLTQCPDGKTSAFFLFLFFKAPGHGYADQYHMEYASQGGQAGQGGGFIGQGGSMGHPPVYGQPQYTGAFGFQQGGATGYSGSDRQGIYV